MVPREVFFILSTISFRRVPPAVRNRESPCFLLEFVRKEAPFGRPFGKTLKVFRRNRSEGRGGVFLPNPRGLCPPFYTRKGVLWGSDKWVFLFFQGSLLKECSSEFLT